MKRALLITSQADFEGGPEHVIHLQNKPSLSIKEFVVCPNDYAHQERYRNIIGKNVLFLIPHRKKKTRFNLLG